jgi:hypothetical protein
MILKKDMSSLCCHAPLWAEGQEMARDEARHGKAFAGLLKRYFGK